TGRAQHGLSRATIDPVQAVSTLKPARVSQGVVGRPLHAELLTIGFVDIDPGVLVPEHRHDNEQVGFVQRGSVTMTIAGQARELGVGETYSIAGGVPHSAKAGADGASVVDVFAPGREDWKTAPTVEPFAGRWP